ncbi:MAG: nitrogenase component 1 [Spirochaetaceae bacterium]|jgi:hypothetical protein|nr:nitrogenase component 1 [Spirochaetaceae bacterium]
MKDRYTDELSLTELLRDPYRVLGTEAANAGLHYCSPAHGGWGVVKVALLVPEAYLLFVCPSACGRHGAIAAIEQGYRHRIGYLCINDREIVLGDYEAEIERAVRELMLRVRPRPKALMIFMSCIDDLLGTDHAASLARMEAEQGIPIKIARMNPISMDGALPPGVRVQKSLYEFLEAPMHKDRGIITLVAYRPPTQDSELAQLLGYYGFGPLGHPEYCADFADFKRLSQSAAALILRPEGKAAAEDLHSRLGIPSLAAFMAFDRPRVLEQYRRIIAFLRDIDKPSVRSAVDPADYFRDSLARREARAAEARALLGDARVAVDSTVTIAPFDLALALVKEGINVNRIYTAHLPAFERASLEELARLKGTIIVANPNHVRKYGPPPDQALADVAVGFEAGYASAAPITVPLAFDEQLYGFEGFTLILEGLIRFSREGKSDLRRQVKDYGLVI